MEVAVEFQNLLAPGGVAGDADRHHRHLGAGAGVADSLDGRDDLREGCRKLLVLRCLGGGDDPHVEAADSDADGGMIVPTTVAPLETL